MSKALQTTTISCKNLGFNPNKNANAVPLNAMISDSKNVNLHEGGVGKRGGTIPMNSSALSGTPDINGLYQFKTTTGSEILIAGTSAGNIISNPLAASPTTLKSGLSTNLFFNFITYNDDVYVIPYGTTTTTTILAGDAPWQARTMPASRNWTAIAWNGTVFCAVATGTDKCATSSNGISWDERTMSSSRSWNSIAWNGTVFCAVASSDQNGATSTDGITWTDRQVNTVSSNFRSIAWNSTVFCVADSGSGAGVSVSRTSTDGITWSAGGNLTARTTWSGIAANGTILCAVNDGYTIYCNVSTNDGASWSSYNFDGDYHYISSIAANGTIFVALEGSPSTSNQCWTSTNGQTWTKRTLPATRAWKSVAWGGSYFVAVATGSRYGAISLDGITWEQIEFPTSANRYGIAYNNSDTFSVIEYGTAASSTSVTAVLAGDAPHKWDGSATAATKIGTPVACTAALAGAGAGNVNNGAHTYKVTFVTASGESDGSPASNSVTTTAGNGQVSLTGIQVGPTGTTSRKVYRTEAGGSTYKLLATIANNTATTYADNIADGSLGAEIPSSNTAATIPTDWATYFPKQMIVHGYGNSERIWCFGTPSKTKWIYITPNNDGSSDADFSQANILTLFIETQDGYGLVGGVEFKDRLYAVGKRKFFVIDDSDPNTDNWGYAAAPWEGGAATHRLIVKTDNDLICMMDNGDIYSVKGAESYGGFELGSIARPHHIHTWIKDNIDLSQIDKFHAIFDPKIRAVRFFMVRQGQGEVDTCISYYVDLGIWGPPEDNLSYSSGFNAACAALVKVSAGNENIYTGDYSGFIWQLNQNDKHDNNNGYEGTFKLPHLSLEQDGVGTSRVNKIFRTGWVVGDSTGDYNLSVTCYIDSGTDSTTATVNLNDSSGRINKDFDIGITGKTISPKFSNSTVNQDFFIEEIMIDYKPLQK